MTVKRIYKGLPFSWQEKSAETISNDHRWLESIVRNAAPFTDWWAKARIVQLAYPTPPGATVKAATALPTYAGLSSETAIVNALRQLCDPAQYPDFHQKVNEDFVIATLNSWKSQQFTQAISRNFEVYADRNYANVFLVTSTAAVSPNVDRSLPPLSRFRPLFNVDELAQIIQTQSTQKLTIRTHGYANPSLGFFQAFADEAKALNQLSTDTTTETTTSPLPSNHFYIGYDWPSEQPFKSPGLWVDYFQQSGILGKFVFTLGLIVGVVGTILLLLLRWIILPLLQALGDKPGMAQVWNWMHFAETSRLAVTWYWIVPTIFLLWALMFLLLRVVVYLRDRNRAIHYGAPDLAEFFWRLDKALAKSNNAQRQLRVNMIGHSMGALVLVNTLRILSDRFGKDDQGSLAPDFLPQSIEPGAPLVAREATVVGSRPQSSDEIGDHFRLAQMILASPDIPLEFLREGRNNYVRSAMRRCEQIYLFSSDRDIVLRYLATLSNWFSEPSIVMAGMRLGNVYLKPVVDGGTENYRPYLRIWFHSQAAVRPTSSYDLFRKFNYVDCSEMKGLNGKGGVNGVAWPLNSWVAIPIDLINMAFYFFKINQVDVHGGYFQTHTLSFKLLKFLIVADDLPNDPVRKQIESMVQGSKIRFWPSQPWIMPEETQE